MVAVWCNGRRGSCDECRGSGGANLLIYLKDNLGAHAWPDHDIDLEEGEKARHTAIVSNIMAIDYIALSRDKISDISGQFGDPNPECAYSSVERCRRVAVNVRVFPVTEAIYFIRNGLSHANGAVNTIDKLARERLRVTLPGRNVIIVMIKAGMEATISRANA